MSDAEKLLEELSFAQKFKKDFLNKRKVFLWGGVNDQSAKEVVDQLLYLENKDGAKEITLYINSPGGVVTSGMIIYDCMKMISSPVNTVCIGLAASMGSIILSGGTKGKREIWPSGKVMIHQPAIGGTLQGQASDIAIHAAQILKTKEMGARILAENCGVSIEKIYEDFERDYWMNADESLKYGIVDTITKTINF